MGSDVTRDDQGAVVASRARVRVALAAGVLAVVVALVALAWVVVGLLDPLMDRGAADLETEQLRSEWSRAADTTAPVASPQPTSSSMPAPSAPARDIPGSALALLRIADFGTEFEVPIMVGVDSASLRKGVGWHPETSRPGAVGNFVVAGHAGVRGPFVPLPDLRPGAEVIVETRDAVFTYEVDNHPDDQRVLNSELWILDPVPGSPGTTPTLSRITLYTCSDLFRSPWRSVAFGHLVGTQLKAPRG